MFHPQERVQKRTVEQVVNVSVEMQRQVPLIQEVQGIMEVPHSQYIESVHPDSTEDGGGCFTVH